MITPFTDHFLCFLSTRPVVIDPAVNPEEDGLTTEQRAQRLRATLSLEERQQQFKDLLAEKKVEYCECPWLC